MANELIVELRGPAVPEDVNAALTPAEVLKVVRGLCLSLDPATARTTSDPDERDRGIAEAEAAARDHFMVYRQEA